MHLAHEKHMLPDILFHEREVDPRARRWPLHAGLVTRHKKRPQLVFNEQSVRMRLLSQQSRQEPK